MKTNQKSINFDGSNQFVAQGTGARRRGEILDEVLLAVRLEIAAERQRVAQRLRDLQAAHCVLVCRAIVSAS